MGVVIAANVFYSDGTIERIEEQERLIALFRHNNKDACIALEYAYDPALLAESALSGEGMWRYSSLLPLAPGEKHYPLSVGNTPLIASARLREYMGLPALWLKDETRSPTGSNKDRATALVLEYALRTGVQTVSCASTGNVAVSLAVGAAAAGLKAVIFVPAHVADAKLEIMLLTGATVFKVLEGYKAAVELSRAAARAFGWYDRNTGYHPFTLEAKKTVALEIWEQLGCHVPDAVLIPVGDGVTLSAIAKGFRELKLCGVITKIPRLIGVQAAGCQPLKLAWEMQIPVRPVEVKTIADGIAVALPINAAMALHDVRASGGGFISVTDEEILQAVRVLITKGGILAEPAAAAAFAGAEIALQSGYIQRDETIVALVTGTGLKTLPLLSPLRSNNVFQVHAQIAEVQKALTAV
ncbi:threonine synthase [Ktedonobacteria bacterium brp13]|nr:threonine synthase [Ktedonobacteria bacterium brp13]